MARYIRWFDEIGMDDLPLVGGKNASLGEMRRELKAKSVNVPNGFCVTVDGYRHFIEDGEVLGIRFLADRGKVVEAIEQILSDLDIDKVENLVVRGSKVRRLIQSIDFPQDLEEEIIEAY